MGPIRKPKAAGVLGVPTGLILTWLAWPALMPAVLAAEPALPAGMAMAIVPEDQKRLDEETRALNGVKPINQQDDRKDWYAVIDPLVQDVVSASPAVVRQSALVATKSGTYSLDTNNLTVNVKLCQGESFGNQLQAAYCSAVLVAPDAIATAGHCVRGIGKKKDVPALSEMRIVFGFRAANPSDPGQREYGADQVFEVAGILNSSTDQDWALLKLSKAVPPAVATPIQSIATAKIKTGEPVYTVGYPSGLPVKYADGADVRKNDSAVAFVANLDTFRGNSGSGVFTKATNALVGLLVGGATDYYADGTVADGCFRAYRCLNPTCGGEEVTRIELMKLR